MIAETVRFKMLLLIGMVVLSGCAGKKVAEDLTANVPSEVATKSELKTEDGNLPLTSFDYSDRVFGPDFEERILSPIRRLQNFHADGNNAALSVRITCNGKKNNERFEGRWICKNSAGKRVISVYYRNGRKNGWAREWDDDKILKTENFWSNDLLSGTAKAFDVAQQETIIGGFKKNLRNGRFTKFNSKGAKTASATYKDGKLSGTSRIFFPNGNLKRRLHYVDDLASGEYWSWYGNGNIESHGFMRGGIQTGVWQFWSEAGAALQDRKFDE